MATSYRKTVRQVKNQPIKAKGSWFLKHKALIIISIVIVAFIDLLCRFREFCERFRETSCKAHHQENNYQQYDKRCDKDILYEAGPPSVDLTYRHRHIKAHAVAEREPYSFFPCPPVPFFLSVSK